MAYVQSAGIEPLMILELFPLHDVGYFMDLSLRVSL